MPTALTPSSKSLCARVTASLPFLVTVIVHVALVAVAGYFVVSEQILGKKKSFEASNAFESNVAQKRVEHRLQVARKGGGSASASPVAASRIFSADSNALQLPSPPELNLAGAGALAGMGFGSGAGGVGTGTGYSTGIGKGNGLGSGFMSMSFLGTTNQRASKVVFVIEVGPRLLDIRKGGFEAFAIIREEIMKLVSHLSPNTEFGFVLFDSNADMGGRISPFSLTLLPATSGNKSRFFEWIKPLNTDSEKLGLSGVSTVAWEPKQLPNAGLDPDVDYSLWLRALRCALEMGPDTIFTITTEAGRARRDPSDAEIAKHKQNYIESMAEFRASGLDPDAISAARRASNAKGMAELQEINEKLKAKGKPPFVVMNSNRIWEADFQASLRKAGFTIKRDLTGWTTKEGKPINVPNGNRGATTLAYTEVLTYVSQLQRALLKDRAVLNTFLFTGPNEDPKVLIEQLGKLSSRNGGKVQLLTTKRLKELAAGEADEK